MVISIDIVNSIPNSFLSPLLFFIKNEYQRLFFSHNLVRKILLARLVSSHAEQSIKQQHQLNLLKMSKLLIYLYYGLGFVRMLFISYLQYHPFPKLDLVDFGPYDPVFTVLVLFIHFFAFPYTLAAFSLAFAIFPACLDYYMTFRLDEHMLAMPYFVAVNGNFRKCLLSQIVSPITLAQLRTSPVMTIQRLIGHVRFLVQKGASPLNQQPTTHNYRLHPRLSVLTRTRAALYTLLLEAFGVVVLLGIMFTIVTINASWALLIFNRLYSEELSLPMKLRFLVLVPLELFIIPCISYYCLNNFVFVMQHQLFSVFILRQHSQNINRLLEQTFLSKSRQQRAYRSSTSLFYTASRISSLFLREHCSLVIGIDHLDRRIVSGCAFSGFFTNVPLNIHIVAQLFLSIFYHSAYPNEMFIKRIWIFFTLQNHCVGLLSFGVASSTIYHYLVASAPLLHCIQLKSSVFQRFLTTCQKLKLANYFQLLHSTSNQKPGIHFGTLGLVNKKSCFDFLILYSGYLLYAFKMIRKNNT